MKVSINTLRKMIREAVDECRMDEQSSGTDPIDTALEDLPGDAGRPPTSHEPGEPVHANLRTSHDAPNGELPQRAPRSVVPEAAIRRLVRSYVLEALKEVGELPTGSSARVSRVPGEIPTAGATSRHDPRTHLHAAGTSGGLNWTGSAPAPRASGTTARRAPAAAPRSTSKSTTAPVRPGSPRTAMPSSMDNLGSDMSGDPLASGDAAVDASLGLGGEMVFERFIRNAVRKALRNR